MKAGLAAGQTAELIWVVDPSMTITLGGDPRATVFSTPNMILLMERAAREALRPYLDESEESVGVEVNIEHLGPAGLGDTVRGTARVTEVNGRRIRFDVQAWCGQREIGRGSHVRAVAPVQRLIENLAKVSGDGGQVMSLTPNTGSLPALQTIQVDVARQVATVRLNRPTALNAVNIQMTTELEQVVGWLAGHPADVRVVLLTGAGDAFCAGDDVKELPSLSPNKPAFSVCDRPTCTSLSNDCRNQSSLWSTESHSVEAVWPLILPISALPRTMPHSRCPKSDLAGHPATEFPSSPHWSESLALWKCASPAHQSLPRKRSIGDSSMKSSPAQC